MFWAKTLGPREDVLVKLNEVITPLHLAVYMSEQRPQSLTRNVINDSAP